jgi:hypothetical protein
LEGAENGNQNMGKYGNDTTDKGNAIDAHQIEGSKAATHQTQIVTFGEAAIIHDESAWEDIGSASDGSSTRSWGMCATSDGGEGWQIDLKAS